LKVLLLDPPHVILPPLKLWAANPGLLALAAYIRPEHDVRFVDATALPRPWFDLERILRAEKPDAVCITANITSLAPDALDAARLARDAAPGATIIGGGSHLSLDADRILTGPGRGLFDYVVLGEGEETLAELLRALPQVATGEGRDGSAVENIAGLAFMANGGVHRTAPRLHIENLDALPVPAFDLIAFDSPAYKLTSVRDHVHINTSRGCGDDCAFCSEASFWKSRWRGISARRIIEYVGTACDMFRTHVVDFADDSFNWSRERLESFCDELERSGLKIDFWFEARVDHILRDADLLPRLARLGCFQIMLGIESAAPPVLDSYRKRFNLNRSEEAIRLIRDQGIMAMTNIMFGDWNDDADTMEMTYRLVRRTSDFLVLTITTPFPGTPYYRRMEEAGRIEDHDLAHYNFFHAIMPTTRLSRADVERHYYRTLRRFYMQPRIVWESLTARNPYKRKFFRFILRHVRDRILRRNWRQPNYVPFEQFWKTRERQGWKDNAEC